MHNLEHGYTILWYDETIADDDDQMDAAAGVANKLAGHRQPPRRSSRRSRGRPRTARPSPTASTSRSRTGPWAASARTDPAKQVGVWQYCSAASGAALYDFMKEYPYTDSPEPNAADPVTTFADVLDRPAARRPRSPAGDLLRPRHRRARRAVGDDVRQLGREDRLAAGRGARPGARRPLRLDLPTPLARAGVPRRRLDGRPASVDRSDDDAGRRACAAPTASTAGRPRGRRRPVLACSLRPMGARFADPLPAGVHDVGVEVWSQPDAFSPWDPPDADDAGADRTALTQRELWSAAAAGSRLTDGGRLITEANPASPPGLATFTEPLARGGSLVLVAHPDAAGGDDAPARERDRRRVSDGSAGQVVGPSLAQEPRGREPVADAWISHRLPVVLSRTTRSGCPVSATSLIPSTQLYGVRSSGTPAAGQPAGAVAAVHAQLRCRRGTGCPGRRRRPSGRRRPGGRRDRAVGAVARPEPVAPAPG